MSLEGQNIFQTVKSKNFTLAQEVVFRTVALIQPADQQFSSEESPFRTNISATNTSDSGFTKGDRCGQMPFLSETH